MKPRRTPSSNDVLRLAGGNEDNDLHVRRDHTSDGQPYIASVWEPDPDERAALSAGANLELAITGESHPPVGLAITWEQPRSRPQHGAHGPGPRLWAELRGHLVVDLIDVLAKMDRDQLEPDALERLAEFERHLDAGLAVLARRTDEPA